MSDMTAQDMNEMTTAYLWVSLYAVDRGEDPYLARCVIDGGIAIETGSFAAHAIGAQAFENEADARFAAEKERAARLAKLRIEVARLTGLNFVDAP